MYHTVSRVSFFLVMVLFITVVPLIKKVQALWSITSRCSLALSYVPMSLVAGDT
jgi:hypothetical protein